MKKLLLILIALPMIGFGQNVNIPDANFKAYLVGNSSINTNGDTEIQISEANAFGGTIDCENMNIADLTGIEDFTALTFLNCSYNYLFSLDVSQNIALISLLCSGNQLLSSLDVSQNTALVWLYCTNSLLLTSLDVSQNTALTYLVCNDNQLTTLDVSGATALSYLDCSDNQITILDVSGATALTTLYCGANQITILDVSNSTALTSLECNINQITSLNVSQNTALIHLWCSYNQLTSLDVRSGSNQYLNTFWADNNPNLTCINVDYVIFSNTYWNQIDSQHYFSTNCPPLSAIEEHTINKEVLKVTDLLGRETKQTNQPLFYIYDDGTVEKRIVIE